MMHRHDRLSMFYYITTMLLSISTTVRASFFGRSPLVVAFMSASGDRGDDDIVLPEREYGYAKEPFTWANLRDIIEELNLAKLSRSVEQQREYMIYTRGILREWVSVYDHILHTKFQLEKRLVKNSNATNDGRNETLWEAYPPLSEISHVRKKLCPNDFPYYMADGIEHWCLWKLCEDITNDDVEEAKEDLRRRHGGELDFLTWRNPPHLKSLPDIDHIHLLIRKTSVKS
jgi:hypothetical protein